MTFRLRQFASKLRNWSGLETESLQRTAAVYAGGTVIVVGSGLIAYMKSEYWYLNPLRAGRIKFRDIPVKRLTPKICVAGMNESADNFPLIPKSMVTNSIATRAVFHKPWYLRIVPDECKTQTMFDRVVDVDPDNLFDVPTYGRTPALCAKSVMFNPYNIKFVPKARRTEDMRKKCLEHDAGNLGKYFK